MQSILIHMRAEGLVSDGACQAVERLWADGTPLDSALAQASGLPEEKLLAYLASRFGLTYENLEEWQPEDGILERFPARVLLKHNLMPLREENGVVLVATNKAFDSLGLDELRLTSGCQVRPVLAPSAEIQRCIRRYLGVGADTVQSLVSDSDAEGIQVIDVETDGTVDLTQAAGDASIIKLVNQVLSEAIDLSATDVHFEPFEGQLKVRYRVDGMLQEAHIPPEVGRFQAAIVSRLKILSQLDIAEKRLPQDGRVKLKIGAHEMDVRVSVIPMLHGEAVVLRLLDRGAPLLGMEHLGMSPRDEASLERILKLPHGIVLVTGPTGSGKTTTLYAALSRLNNVERKIITIEDPVEYHLAGINQIQVSTKAGLTFGRGLRSILRHDPDVILIGEIRDRETADIAVQASLTGHLVFSTLHTNDAPSSLMRLVDMGVEPYLVASSLEAVLAQRLVRLVCPHCKTQYKVPEREALQRELGMDVPEMLSRGAGCRECQGTGFRGRTAVMEFMPVSERIRALILERASAGELRRAAEEEGMQSLRKDGWRHVLNGRTTVEEILRVTKDVLLNGDAPAAPANGSAREGS